MFKAHDLVTDRWLQADGRLGAEATAPTLTVLSEPTEGERAQIRARVWALAGGVLAYTELEQQLNEVTVALDAEIYDAPEFAHARFDGETERPAAEVQASLAAARVVWSGPLAQAHRELRSMLDRLQLMAAWSVLAVDPPEGLRTLEDLDGVGVDVVQILFNAMHLCGKEGAAGKALSSPS